jgi:hypothetical protein
MAYGSMQYEIIIMDSWAKEAIKCSNRGLSELCLNYLLGGSKCAS